MLTLPRDKLTRTEAIIVATVERDLPAIVAAREIVDAFHRLLSGRNAAGLAPWLEGAFRHFGGVTTEVLVDNAKALVTHHDAAKREVTFNGRFMAFARYWGFRPRACLGRFPLRWIEADEGKHPLAGFLRAVGDGAAFQAPLAQERLAAGPSPNSARFTRRALVPAR